MKNITRSLFENFWAIFQYTIVAIFVLGMIWWFGPVRATALFVAIYVVGFLFLAVGIWLGVTIVEGVRSARRRLREWAWQK